MKSIEIKVTERKELGKKASKELRKKDFVPCVLYGGDNVFHFTAHENEFRHLVYTPNSYIVKLDIGGKEHLAMMKDIQFHPVSDKILAIDFLQISEDKKVTIAVPVKLIGFSEGVKSGGQLALECRKVKVRGFANDLPDEITIDVSPIVLGQSLKVSDLEFPAIDIVEPDNTVVLSVKLTRVARSAATDEEEEGEEGEGEEGEGEGEEGGAPTEGSAPTEEKSE